MQERLTAASAVIRRNAEDSWNKLLEVYYLCMHSK